MRMSFSADLVGKGLVHPKIVFVELYSFRAPLAINFMF